MTTKTIATSSDQASAGGQNDQENPDGWLQETSLLYRLTDDRIPYNCDEINVTQANGSRSLEARTRRASELLNLLRKSATDSAASSDSCADCEPGAFVYAACYTSCTNESSMKTLSLHATRSGAEAAVAEHKRAQRAFYDEWADEKYQALYPWSDEKGSGDAAWAIDEFEVLP